MTISHVHDAKHWRDKAAEMRILSTMMDHIETQAIMISLADDYDKLADRTAQTSNGEPPNS